MQGKIWAKLQAFLTVAALLLLHLSHDSHQSFLGALSESVEKHLHKFPLYFWLPGMLYCIIPPLLVTAGGFTSSLPKSFLLGCAAALALGKEVLTPHLYLHSSVFLRSSYF